LFQIQERVEELQRDLKKIDTEKNRSSVSIQQAKKKCLAEICVPGKAVNGVNKVVSLNMNLDEMRKLLQNI